jgi:hypothetical protein
MLKLFPAGVFFLTFFPICVSVDTRSVSPVPVRTSGEKEPKFAEPKCKGDARVQDNSTSAKNFHPEIHEQEAGVCLISLNVNQGSLDSSLSMVQENEFLTARGASAKHLQDDTHTVSTDANQVESSPPVVDASTSNFAADKKDLREEYKDLIQMAKKRGVPKCGNVHPETIVYNFAIGSFFNDGSVQSSLAKAHLERKNKLESYTDRDLNDAFEAAKKEMNPCYAFAQVRSGMSRRWTYPSGVPWNIWAVSLHNEDNSTEPVFGAVMRITEDQFIAFSLREEYYEIVSIDPELLTSGVHEQPLLDQHPCQAVAVYAYGYNSIPTKSHDIFDHPRLSEFRGGFDFATAEALCKAKTKHSGKDRQRRKLKRLIRPKETEDCIANLKKAKGMLLAQSYLDVILSGLLNHGTLLTQGDIFGGVREFHDQARDRARLFLETTVWPIEEVADGSILYINDRHCPRNPNPLFALGKGDGSGGTASSTGNIEELWKQIDFIMNHDRRSTGARAMLQHRLENVPCQSLAHLQRWTDRTLRSTNNIFKNAYEHANLTGSQQLCPD